MTGNARHLPIRSVRATRLAALLLALVACAGGDRDAKAPAVAVAAGSVDSASATPEVAGAASALSDTVVGGGCPEWGLWRECSVESRIARAGLAVRRRVEPVRHKFLSVDGIVWETSRAEIQVFLYASEADRVRDLANVDSATVAPRGERIIWRQPATLVTSANMAAIIISLNPRQSERIALALGAGLPARGPG